MCSNVGSKNKNQCKKYLLYLYLFSWHVSYKIYKLELPLLSTVFGHSPVCVWANRVYYRCPSFTLVIALHMGQYCRISGPLVMHHFHTSYFSLQKEVVHRVATTLPTIPTE